MGKEISEDAWALYLGALRTGSGPHKAAKELGAGWTKRKVDSYLAGRPDRRLEAEDAEDEAAGALEEVLYEMALAGDTWAMGKWLSHRAPQRWKEAPETGIAVFTPESLQFMLKRFEDNSDVVYEDAEVYEIEENKGLTEVESGETGNDDQ